MNVPLIPRAGWNLVMLGKSPRYTITTPDTQEISYGRAYLNARKAIWIWFGRLAVEYILPIISVKWTAILPLGITYFTAVVDDYPPAFA
jgi:hypothetical protein